MPVTLGLVQPRLAAMQPKVNIDRCLRLARRLPDPDLIVFPELASSGQGFRTAEELARVAEDIREGPSSLAMQSLSHDAGCTVVAGIPEKDGGKVYNAALIAHDGRPVDVYRKRHLHGREARLFAPGDRPPEVHRLGRISLAVMICLDLGFVREFPLFEAGGVNVIAHPSNLSLPEGDRTRTVRPVRRSAYIVTANRIGRDAVFGEATEFTGRSMILAPDLQILKLAPHDTEEAISVTVGAETTRLPVAQEV